MGGGSDGLGAAPAPNTSSLEAALRRLAEWTPGQGGLDGPRPYAAVRRLLCRQPGSPGDPPPPAVEDGLERARRWASRLRAGYLAVQGPPGTGKTFTAARLIVHLLAQRRRVGITGLSHAFVRQLPNAALVEAESPGVAAVQKVSQRDQASSRPEVTGASDNGPVERGVDQGAFNLVAGTVFLFCRPGRRLTRSPPFLSSKLPEPPWVGAGLVAPPAGNAPRLRSAVRVGPPVPRASALCRSPELGRVAPDPPPAPRSGA